MFSNRPDPEVKDLSKELELLAAGCEMLCIEVAAIHGTYSKRYGIQPSKGGEGGFYLIKLLAPGPDSELAQLVRSILQELGWSES